jgi:hypothetical protein
MCSSNSSRGADGGNVLSEHAEVDLLSAPHGMG